MLKILIYFLCLVFSFNSFAQTELEQLFIKTKPDCDDIKEGSVKLLKQYYSQSNFDSAQIITNYWIQNCGNNEYNKLVKLGLLIHRNGSELYNIDSLDMLFLFDYRVLIESRRKERFNSEDDMIMAMRKYYNVINPSNEFFELELLILNDLKVVYSNAVKGSLQHVIAGTLIGEQYSIFDELSKNKTKEFTPIYRHYNELKQSIAGEIELLASLEFGRSIQYGNLQRLGNHNVLIGSVLVKDRRNIYELNFGSSENRGRGNYSVMFNNTLTQANRADVFHVGLRYNRVWFCSKPFQFYSGFGAHYANVYTDMIPDDNNEDTDADDEDDQWDLHAFMPTITTGMFINSYYTPRIKIEFQYRLLPIVNRGGTNVSGSDICLTIGYVFNPITRKQALKVARMSGCLKPMKLNN